MNTQPFSGRFRSGQRRDWPRPLTLFLLALTIRVAIAAWWRFDGLYGQDAFAYFNQGMAIAERGFPPVNFFWPNGYPLLIALATWFVGPTAVAAQGVSLVLGAAVAPLVYYLARDLWGAAGRSAGWLAGLIVATAGQPVLSSISAMADMPALFWAVLAAWLVVHACNRPSPTRFFITGIVLGLSIVTRWIYALVAPALLLYSLLRLPANRRTTAVAALPGALVPLVPQLVFSLNRPESLLHDFLINWTPVHFWQRSFLTPEGAQFYELPVGLFYAQTFIHPAYIFPFLGVTAVFAVTYLWRKGERPALSLLLGWSGAVYLFLAGIPFENFRFNLALYPPLVILSGVGLVRLRTHLNHDTAWRGLVVLSLLSMTLWTLRMNGQFLTAVAADKAIVQAVTAVIPGDKALVTFGLTLVADHYTELTVHDLFLLDDADFTSLADGDTYYLLVDTSNVTEQWAGLAPENNLRRLTAEATLAPLEQIGSYTLYWAVPVGEATFGANPMLDAQRGP